MFHYFGKTLVECMHGRNNFGNLSIKVSFEAGGYAGHGSGDFGLEFVNFGADKLCQVGFDVSQNLIAEGIRGRQISGYNLGGHSLFRLLLLASLGPFWLFLLRKFGIFVGIEVEVMGCGAAGFSEQRFVPFGSKSVSSFSCVGINHAKLIGIRSKLMTEARFVTMFWKFVTCDWWDGVVLWEVLSKEFFQIFVEPVAGFR